MQQGQANLLDAPEIWNRVAREENEGNLDLIDKTLRAKAPDALKADYDRAAGPALDALRGFTKFLKDDLSKKTSDWRLGKEKYDQKFAYTLVSGKKPEQVLSEAEAALKDVRDQMAKLAAPQSVKAALDKIAQQHTTPGALHGSGQEGSGRSHQLRPRETPGDAAIHHQSASDSHARVHARHLFGGGFQCRARAGAATGRILLGDAHSARLAQGARRIEAARIQSLRHDGDHHS